MAQLTAAIAAMTINNGTLVATNYKLGAEVTTLTKSLGRNSDVTTSTISLDKCSPKTYPH